ATAICPAAGCQSRVTAPRRRSTLASGKLVAQAGKRGKRRQRIRLARLCPGGSSLAAGFDGWSVPPLPARRLLLLLRSRRPVLPVGGTCSLALRALASRWPGHAAGPPDDDLEGGFCLCLCSGFR